jgi:dTDP-glucose pyrophosphorylase/CBS domain-containing protein
MTPSRNPHAPIPTIAPSPTATEPARPPATPAPSTGAAASFLESAGMSDRALLGPDTTIYELIVRFTSMTPLIGHVVDDRRCLLGTVTDGDIRRGLLRGVATSDPVSAIMNRQPRTFRFGEPQGDVLAFMRRERVQHVPILDFAGRVVDLLTVDSLLQPRPQDMPVVLMAGGQGLRLRPLTETTPKPMLEIGGRPILETIVRRLAAAGFANFHISVNYRADIIRNHFGDGDAFGVNVQYIEETEPLGTAGPLGLLPRDLDKPVMVMNADVLTKLDPDRMIAFHTQNRGMATMGVREHEIQVPYGVVDLENSRIVGLREKPVERYFINAGVYILGPEARRLIPAGAAFDMPSLFEACNEANLKTLAFPIREYWVDIGRPDDFRRANDEFASIF